MYRIKELRKNKKVSQQNLAKSIGVHYRTLQNWENGISQIKEDKAKILADYFGVSVPFLLGYEEEKPKEEKPRYDWEEIKQRLSNDYGDYTPYGDFIPYGDKITDKDINNLKNLFTPISVVKFYPDEVCDYFISNPDGYTFDDLINYYKDKVNFYGMFATPTEENGLTSIFNQHDNHRAKYIYKQLSALM